MNKIFTFVYLFLSISCSVYAGRDKAIKVEQLPQNAQNIIENYFPGIGISFAKTDNEIFDTNFEVFLVNGYKIAFDRKGNWIDINCKYGEVPEEIIPKKIRDFLTKNHTEHKVLRISKENNCKVELDNGIKLKFNLKFDFRGYDN